MSRTMYDSITATDIPANAQVVAGYVNGTYRWSDADWARFPQAVKVRIATQAYVNDGHVLDVEPGDATPAQAPGWVKMRRAAGADPTVYCSASALATVQAAFTAAGVAQPHYWIAHYDNVPSLPSGCVAKQYIDPPTSGGHYDLSIVADYWPGVDNTNQGELVATPEEIKAIATETVNQLMSRTVGTGEPETSTQFPFSTMVRYTQFDASKINAVSAKLDVLAAKASGATAEEIAAALLPALTSATAAAVANLDVSQMNKISDADAQQIAQAVTDRAAALLGTKG